MAPYTPNQVFRERNDGSWPGMDPVLTDSSTRLVQATDNGGQNTSGAQWTLSATWPGASTAGNLGFYIVAAYSSQTSTHNVATPSGWTLIGSTPSGPDLRTYLFYRVLTGGDANPSGTIGGGGANTYASCVLAEFSGTTSIPYDTSAFYDPGGWALTAVESPTGTTAITAQADELWVAFKAGYQSFSSIDPYEFGLVRHRSVNGTQPALYVRATQASNTPGTASATFYMSSADRLAAGIATFKGS